LPRKIGSRNPKQGLRRALITVAASGKSCYPPKNTEGAPHIHKSKGRRSRRKLRVKDAFRSTCTAAENGKRAEEEQHQQRERFCLMSVSSSLPWGGGCWEEKKKEPRLCAYRT